MTPAAGEAQQPHRSQLHPRSLHIRRPYDDLDLDLRRSRDPDVTREGSGGGEGATGGRGSEISQGFVAS